MEDDDLFCTRCGKEVPRQSAEGAEAAQKGAGAPGRRPEPDSARKVRRGMMYGNPQKDDLDEEYEGGRKVDRVTVMLLAAAAVLLVVLGSLVFRIMNTSRRGDESGAQNAIAVYDDNNRGGEQNLNQGLQAPSAGQAGEQEGQNEDVQEQIPYQDPQTLEPQTNAAPAQAEDSSQLQEYTDSQQALETQEPEEDFDEEDFDEEEYDEEDYIEEEETEAEEPEEEFDQEEYVEEEPVEEDFDQEEYVEEEPVEKDFDEEDYAEEDFSGEDEDDEYGWVTDEDGNEAYYFREGEEFEVDDQTGGVGMQAPPAPASQTPTAAQQGSGSQSASGTSALSGTSAPGSSDYILSESNSRYYTEQELRGLDDNTLQMAINEIYARHGRRFNTESMQQYFDGKDWYSGTVDPVEFDGNEALYFNEYEVGNRELMSRIRAERQQALPAAGQ